MEDNDKDDDNFKDISALGLDRDLEFSREHPTKSTLTIPNQTKPNQTKPNQTQLKLNWSSCRADADDALLA